MPDALSPLLSGLLSAFITGLLGSAHCIGMCGGIVGTLTMRLPGEMQQSPRRLLPYLLTYNLGRISSYTLAGLLVGVIGAQFTHLLPDARTIGLVGGLLAGGFMIALGLYLGNWWPALGWLEKLGAHLWRWIEPLGRRFFPVTTPWRALGLGLVWGWLPCGLVYTALALALSVSLQAESGMLWSALVMFAFGLGTLPMLFAMGSAAYWLTQFTRRLSVRRILGALVAAFGVLLILEATFF